MRVIVIVRLRVDVEGVREIHSSMYGCIDITVASDRMRENNMTSKRMRTCNSTRNRKMITNCTRIRDRTGNSNRKITINTTLDRSCNIEIIRT